MGLASALKSLAKGDNPPSGKRAVPFLSSGKTQKIPSVCQMCVNTCGIIIKVENGVVVGIEGNPDNPHNYGRLCAKGISALMGLYNPHRVLTPLKRTNSEKGIGIDPKWEPIAPEAAWQIIVQRLRRVMED